MLTVFVWKFRGKNVAWGHASLQVDLTYMSWWPGGDRDSSKMHRNIYTAGPIRNRTFAQDVAAENQRPDYSVRIVGLNESRIKDWWQSFGLTRDGQLYQGPLLPWNTLEQNCSTVVARALSIGGAESLVPWHKSWNVVWTPNDVYDYAASVQRATLARGAG
jgi:hypothetical protein